MKTPIWYMKLDHLRWRAEGPLMLGRAKIPAVTQVWGGYYDKRLKLQRQSGKVLVKRVPSFGIRDRESHRSPEARLDPW